MKVNAFKVEIAMAESGLTYTDLAQKSGVSQATISHVRNGKTCRPDICGKLAKALDVPVMDIVADNNTSKGGAKQ